MSHNAQNMRLWLDALRSGEFQQAQRALRKPNGWCCLGVACEVFRRVTGNGEWTTLEQFHVDGYVADGVLSDPVIKWLGVDGDDPMDVSFDNDAGLSFTTIADKLEAEYPC